MHRIALLPLVAFSLVASACEDPPPGKLFDEEGAWSMVQYDLGESLHEIDPQTREDAFMLSFDSHNRVVTTAACVGTDGQGMVTDATPETSPCKLLPSSTIWQCRCFAYAFQDDVMQWQEFNAGEMPPKVAYDPMLEPGEVGTDDGTGGGSGGMGGGAGITALQVIGIPEQKSTYDFRPLPAGVFGGDGQLNHFIFEARANSRFERAYADPDGRMSCGRCVPE